MTMSDITTAYNERVVTNVLHPGDALTKKNVNDNFK